MSASRQSLNNGAPETFLPMVSVNGQTEADNSQVGLVARCHTSQTQPEHAHDQASKTPKGKTKDDEEVDDAPPPSAGARKLRKWGPHSARRARYPAMWHHGAEAVLPRFASPQNWLCSQPLGCGIAVAVPCPSELRNFGMAWTLRIHRTAPPNCGHANQPRLSTMSPKSDVAEEAHIEQIRTKRSKKSVHGGGHFPGRCSPQQARGVATMQRGGKPRRISSRRAHNASAPPGPTQHAQHPRGFPAQHPAERHSAPG